MKPRSTLALVTVLAVIVVVAAWAGSARSGGAVSPPALAATPLPGRAAAAPPVEPRLSPAMPQLAAPAVELTFRYTIAVPPEPYLPPARTLKNRFERGSEAHGAMCADRPV